MWSCQGKTKTNTEKVVKTETAENDKVMPKMLDFTATWCPPCKMMAPIITEIEKKYEGKIVIEKVDIDQNRELAQQYEITGVPTLVFLDTLGNETNRLVGFQNAEALTSAIDTAIK